MRSRITFIKSIFIALYVAFLSGCVNQEKLTSKTDGNGQSWTVTLAVTGGFAGWIRNLSVDSNGQLIINDLKANKGIRKKLNNKELEDLSSLVSQLENAKSVSKTLPFTKKCADCIQYKVSIRWQNSQVLASLNDINLHKSPYKSLVLFSRKIMSNYYK